MESRIRYKRQEGGCNKENRWDFGARVPRRASAKSPIVDRRSSVNRSSCGRRTSPSVGRLLRAADPTSTYIYRPNCKYLASREVKTGIEITRIFESLTGRAATQLSCCWLDSGAQDKPWKSSPKRQVLRKELFDRSHAPRLIQNRSTLTADSRYSRSTLFTDSRSRSSVLSRSRSASFVTSRTASFTLPTAFSTLPFTCCAVPSA